MYKRLKLVILSFGLLIAMNGAAMEKPVKYFVKTTDPACLFAYTEFDAWTAQVFDGSTLRYLPSEKLKIRFEAPPAVILVDSARIEGKDVQSLGPKEKSKLGVPVEKVFLKGWEKAARRFQQGEQKIYLLEIESHPQHGLPGDQINLLAQNSFEFLDRKNLSESQIRKLLEASEFREKIFDAEKVSPAKALAFKIVKQDERYVVSFAGFRGGPVFHINQKDLKITIQPRR